VCSAAATPTRWWCRSAGCSTILELPSTDDEQVVETDDADEPAVAEETSAPWKPVFDQTDDLDGLLVARSPLLSRAFGKRDVPTPPR
jgi:hypothetical protein